MENQTNLKSEIVADEARFQRACSAYVGRNVLYCVSRLFWPMSQDLEAASKLFDEDYDEMFGWFQRADWESPVEELIADADLDDLERIAEKVGDWDDVLAESNLPEVLEVKVKDEDEDEDENELTNWVVAGVEYVNEYDAIEAARKSAIDAIRHNVSALITSDDEYQRIARDFNLDPEYHAVYEHWLVDSYFASELEAHGELVFSFCNMIVWGRCTTGQSIALDGVIRQIVLGLPEHHWIWKEVR